MEVMLAQNSHIFCGFFCAFQAPANMKSVLQAGWLLTVAFGNVIVLIVAEGAGLEQVWQHTK